MNVITPRGLFCLLILIQGSMVSAGTTGMGTQHFIEVTSLTASPSLSPPNTFTFSAAFSTNEHKNEVSASINFGDGTTVSATGDHLSALNGVTHTYAAPGVYFVRASGFTPFMTATADLFLVVGRGSVVNATNGIVITATDANGQPRAAGGASPRYAGGVTNLTIIPTRAAGNNATTDFSDVAGTTTVSGLKPSKTYAAKGIYVATTTGLNGTTPVGKARKMVIISSRDVSESGALADPPSTDITVKKMQGKFDFAGGNVDSVSFSGQVKLPAGFVIGTTPLSIGIGNVIDTASVDEKGKATLADGSRITKLKVKFPKLTGPAAGGEIAQVDATFSTKDMDTLGFDTEGIAASVRADEKKLKAVSRQIQLDILLGGVPYETLAPVSFKLKVDKATGGGVAGQFKGIPTRAAK